jgi:hypothetical protein
LVFCAGTRRSIGGNRLKKKRKEREERCFGRGEVEKGQRGKGERGRAGVSKQGA